MYYIVAYDIPSNRRRTRLMNLLKDYLAHVQESVFEGPLPAVKFEELKAAMTKLLEPENDSVRIYRMPKESWEKTSVTGLPPLTNDRPIIVVSDNLPSDRNNSA